MSPEGNDLLQRVLDTKCSVLRDYILDLENDLKSGEKALARAERLEQGDGDPVDTADAVIKGVNDYLYRLPLEYIRSELVKAKYEFQIAAAELLGINEPKSKYDIEKIKAIPIKDFISRFTIIKNNNQAICPIHREKTPSLHIYEQTNSWYCFGCHTGGSVIDFIMKLEDLDLNRALDYLNKLI